MSASTSIRVSGSESAFRETGWLTPAPRLPDREGPPTVVVNDVDEITNLWTAGGGTGGAIFMAAFGMVPTQASGAWTWTVTNSAKYVVLGLQLWA